MLEPALRALGNPCHDYEKKEKYDVKTFQYDISFSMVKTFDQFIVYSLIAASEKFILIKEFP